MKRILLIVSAVAPLLAGDDEPIKRLHEAVTVFSEIMAEPDQGIPKELLESAHCIILNAGAFVFGGKYGKGVLSCRSETRTGWSASGTVRIEGGSFGFQIGGSETDVVLLVMNKDGADKLLSSKFTLGVEGSIAAGPVGRTATAQTDLQMHADILSWSRSRGLFGGIALGGATLPQDLDDNRTLSGKTLENREIVSNPTTPKAAKELLVMLNKYSRNPEPPAELGCPRPSRKPPVTASRRNRIARFHAGQPPKLSKSSVLIRISTLFAWPDHHRQHENCNDNGRDARWNRFTR